ncbi:hypothetical protein HDU93_008972, partial [Gonapodya sp. JEL0774]
TNLLHLKYLRDLYPAGEGSAKARLDSFIAKRVNSYHEKRDLPNQPGTSSISFYLAAGVLSARQCIVAAQTANAGKRDSGSQGVVIWIQEIIWREFYRHVLAGFPHVCKYRAFKPQYEGIKWEETWTRNVQLPNPPVPPSTDTPPPPVLPSPDVVNKRFAEWALGRTGFPLVDAAMRCLLHTGWMHNRLRMIVSSFLVKDLLVDWRLGEAWFSWNLIDGDFASNNGGWQWAAGTGTDAQPYFRIFNPTSQAEKFDKDGAFVRKWVKELTWVKDGGALAKGPWLTAKQGSLEITRKKMEDSGYPPPQVQHDVARVQAIEAFRVAISEFNGGSSVGGNYGGDEDDDGVDEEILRKPTGKRGAGSKAGDTKSKKTKR